MTNLKKATISLTVATALSFSGCGNSSSDDTTTSPDNISKNYNGAGSKWDISFKSNKTATIKELDANLEINATWEDLDSGFRKITTTSSNDSAIANGAVTYGFELPDYMFPFVAFKENKLVPTVVATGECPSGDIKHNYITSFAKANSSSSDFDDWGTFGYWDIPKTSGNYTIEVFKRDGTRPSNGGSHSGTNGSTAMFGCNNGKIDSNTSSERTTGFFTKSGALIWNQQSNTDERVENDFMIPYEPNLNNINQINGNYIGYLISGNGQDTIGYENLPASVTITDGRFSVKDINIETNVVGNEISTISLTTEVAGTKGLWSGQVTTSYGTEGIGCAIDLDAGGSGKNVVICGGMKPDGTLKKLYSLILVSK